MQKAVREAQEQARKEAERRDSMWGRIAKAVDDAMEAEAPEQIERQHIHRSYCECDSRVRSTEAAPSKKDKSEHLRKEKDKEQEEGQEILSTGEVAQPSNSSNTWQQKKQTRK